MMHSQSGSAAAEFVLAFFFVLVGFLLVFEFIFLAVGNELAGYAAYMGARAMKVYGEPIVAIRKVIPWVDENGISAGADEKDGLRAGGVRIETGLPAILGRETPFSLLNNGFKIRQGAMLMMEPSEVKPYEDNGLR